MPFIIFKTKYPVNTHTFTHKTQHDFQQTLHNCHGSRGPERPCSRGLDTARSIVGLVLVQLLVQLFVQFLGQLLGSDLRGTHRLLLPRVERGVVQGHHAKVLPRPQHVWRGGALDRPLPRRQQPSRRRRHRVVHLR